MQQAEAQLGALRTWCSEFGLHAMCQHTSSAACGHGSLLAAAGHRLALCPGGAGAVLSAVQLVCH